jgi:hypothetical protein
MRLLGTRWLCVGALVTTMVLAGCGSGSPAPHVASVNGQSKDAPKKGRGKTDPKKAMLAFAKCMREHGVDMPDPKFSDNGDRGGTFSISGPSGGAGPADRTKVDAANKACEPLMADAVKSGPDKLDPAQEAKMKKQALAFTRCMRKHGIDMPDPQFGDNGQNTVKIGGGPGGGPTNSGGPDPRNPKFQAAQKACAKGSRFGPGFGAVESKGR